MSTERIFFDGNNYFNALLHDIKQAEQSIDLETYIFEQDNLGKEVIVSLTEAAERGVLVRILIDGAGTPQWNNFYARKLESLGGKVRVFHSFPWNFWQWSRSVLHVPSLLKVLYLLLKINSRNHRKVCIIDNKIAYIGSFNICQRHLARDQKGEGWRDTGIKLINLNLSDLLSAFEAAWDHRSIQERVRHYFAHIRANPVMLLNNTWWRRRILRKNLLRRIKKCKKRIWITNAYFVPDNFLLRRLIDAAQAGIDVRILLPQASDVIFMPWASKAFYARLLLAGVRIFEYIPSMLHAKTLIIDNWMILGSSNLNHRSLLHDLEVDVNVRSPESKSLLEQQFLIDLKSAREIFWGDWQKRAWYQRLVGKIILYLKFML